MPDLLLGPELFRVTVDGQPAGAGSKTAQPIGARGQEKRDHTGRLVLIYRPSSPLTKPWMEDVEAVAGARHGAAEPIDGALWMNVTFYERRPKNHYRADGFTLMPSSPTWPAVTSTHDVDKMRRAISDSLTNAKVIADDKRIIGGSQWKLYCDDPRTRPCAVIVLGRMLHQTVEEAGVQSPPPPGQETLT